MKFGLIIRGQYPQGDDMRLRLPRTWRRRSVRKNWATTASRRARTTARIRSSTSSRSPICCQVALVAPKLRLVPGVVLLPLHSPLHVAEELASLDVMCGGKLVFGAGIGYREVEFKRLRHDAEAGRPALRGVPDRGEAAVDRGLRHDEGLVFRAGGANCTVLPVQKPMPPVWIGANIDVGIRRAARMADAWFVNPHNKLETIARQMEVYRRELDACGKPFPAGFPWRARSSSPARARRRSGWREPSLEAKYKAYRDWGQDKVMPSSDHFDLDFDELVDDRFLIGSLAEVTEQIIDLRRRFGVTTLILGVHWVGMPKSLAMEQMQLLAEEVSRRCDRHRCAWCGRYCRWQSGLPGSASAETPAQVCARLQSDDATRSVPASLVTAINRLFAMKMTDEVAVATTVYRCMDGHVLVCTTGANLPCGKANTGRTSAGAVEWCRGNPNADYGAGLCGGS